MVYDHRYLLYFKRVALIQRKRRSIPFSFSLSPRLDSRSKLWLTQGLLRFWYRNTLQFTIYRIYIYIYIRSFFSFFSFFLLFIFERVALLFTCTNNVRIPYESTYEFIMYEKIVFLFYKKVLSAVRETKHDRWVFRYLVRCYGRSIKLNSW